MNFIKFFLVLLISFEVFSQSHKMGFDEVLNKQSDEIMPFAVPNESETTISFLQKSNITIKQKTKEYIYLNASPKEINQLYQEKKIKDFYFSIFKPELMNDNARELLHVNPVHLGINGLNSSFKGDNIIIGYIDTGCDYQHPDFKDENGNTRIIRYWDHNLPFDTQRTPMPYGYGQVFDSIDINNGIPIPDCSSSHGTTVAGAGSGNGLSTGTNAGTAPNSKIIVVDFNFQAQNWTLKVADACDYIFKIADEYGLPAVVNISLGSYFGSHDGNDPASVLMEALIDEKPGRIIVSSAGNAGNFKNYHIRNQVTNDTTFFWMKNNPSGAFGPNTAFFDLWGTVGQVENINFSFSAVNPLNNFEKRGQTQTYNVLSSFGSPINETILNSNGDTIARLTVFSGTQNGAYNMFARINKIDSTDYYISFNTSGSGLYDAWTGANFGNGYQFVEEIPSVSIYPKIINYILPDSLQSIVSEWNCSEKVISVGNFQNRTEFIDVDSVVYDLITLNNVFPTGKLARSSSIGPTRLNVLKPEISATGDNSVSPGPLCVLTPGNTNVFFGGYHMMNGGTSMASPYIAGIAALYLEKCPKATYQDFMNHLTETAYTDNFTGTIPNFAYGYGKAHALNTLLKTNFSSTILGSETICGNPISLSVDSDENISSYLWSNGSSSPTLSVSSPGTFSVTVTNEKGCKSSATKTIIESTPSSSSVSISASSASSCFGQEINFIASETNGGTNPSFVWKLNGNTVGNNSPFFSSSNFQNGDQIICEMVSSNDCTSPAIAISNVITIQIVGETPSITISSPISSICQGESVTFNSTVTNQGSSPTYQWIVNGVPFGGNSASITLNNLLANTNISCILISSETCLMTNNIESNSITLEVNPITTPSISISVDPDKETICLNESVTFYSQYTNEGDNPIFQWYVGNNLVSSTPNDFVTNSINPGQFVVCKLISNKNCISQTYALSNYVVLNVLDKAVINYSGNGLISLTDGDEYQWVNCVTGEDVEGANNSFFQPTQTGNYRVRILFRDCEINSTCLPIQYTNLETTIFEDFKVYPNPFNEKVHIENHINQELLIKLYSISGQIITEKKSNESSVILPLSNLSSGVYFMQISSEQNQIYNIKLIKEN
jgi:hypothetical protein